MGAILRFHFTPELLMYNLIDKIFSAGRIKIPRVTNTYFAESYPKRNI
jgi:hypothetical protein